MNPQVVTVKEGLSKEKVQANMQQITLLTQNLLNLTERELALLSVAVTEMKAAGFDPFEERFVIQVVPGLQRPSFRSSTCPEL